MWQGLSIFAGGTLHGTVNLYQGSQHATPNKEGKVSFRKTKNHKNTHKRIGTKVRYDPAMINQLMPHQKKAFFRRFFKAGSEEAQLAEIKTAAQVLANNEARALAPFPTYGDHKKHHTPMEEGEEISGDELPQGEMAPDELAKALDEVPKDALSAYVNMNLSQEFIPKKNYDTMMARLRDLEEQVQAQAGQIPE